MIKNDKQRDWDEADDVDCSKLSVGNSAKNRWLIFSGEIGHSQKKGSHLDKWFTLRNMARTYLEKCVTV